MDLHHLVRETADEYPDIADPGELADLVFGRIGPEDYAGTIKLMLRSYVRDVIRTERRATVPEPVQVGLAPSPAPFRPSSFVTGVREEWRRQMGGRIHIGESKWKILRDCTYEDLQSAAGERRRLAAENTASARRYETFATALSENGVDTMGDLPADVLRTILT